MTLRLAGKVAIVTGAASRDSMGFATARRFAAEGAAVMLGDVDGDALAEAVAALEGQGLRVAGQRHDVADEAGWRGLVAATVAAFGPLDILVNNAGIALGRAIEATSADEFDRLMTVNVKGTFFGCREAVRAMRGKGGSIVNVSSVTGLVGVPMNGVYSATKGAIRLLTKSLALEEAANGIRCNSVHPGVIDTPMARAVTAVTPETSALITAAIPMGRVGRAEEVASVSLFLASDEASYVTGAEFVVDGGMTAQ